MVSVIEFALSHSLSLIFTDLVNLSLLFAVFIKYHIKPFKPGGEKETYINPGLKAKFFV